MTMASPSSLLPLVLCLALAPFRDAAKTPAALAPAPQSLNLSAILEKGGQYATLLRLLKETQIGDQIERQLNNSYGGLTLFASSDNTFSNLKPGTLSGLSAQDQVALVLYHVLPRYYTFDMLQTARNPVRTQATGSAGGVYTLNITNSSSQANISAGIDQTRVGSALYDVLR